MKRIFIAIPFKEDERIFLRGIQKTVESHSESGKFHKEENFHLTIEFIGMVPEKLIGPLWREILEAIEGTEVFEITLDHLGQFIKKNKSIPWVGLRRSEELKLLQKQVACAIAKVLTHTVEHSYTPHITLGRQVVIEEMPPLEFANTLKVDTIALMESSSKTGTLLYTPLYSHKLKEGF